MRNGGFFSLGSMKMFSTRKYSGITRRACLAVLVLPLICFAEEPASPATAVNLALHKPATSSSVENEEHNAAQANDGDSGTCWRADDEPEGGPEWWQVDLQKSQRLSGCRICWPYDRKIYRYKIEGSADRKAWVVLSDQTKTVSKKQVQDLKFDQASEVRYVRVTVTGFEEGCWASICEVKLFGVQ